VLCAAAAWHSHMMARMLMAGLVIGSVCKLLTHLWGLRDKLRFVRPTLKWDDPFMRQVMWLALPLIAGIIFAKVRDNINNVYVLSMMTDEGLIQANSIGRKLQGTFHFIIPYTLAKAVFPFFCELVDKRDMRGVGEFVTRYGRMMLGVFFPVCGLVAVIALPLVSLVFKGGKFGDESVAWTAVSMACYTFVMPALALEAVLMQAFFAYRRMVSVTALGIGLSVVSVGFSFLGLALFGNAPAELFGRAVPWFGSHPVVVLGFIAGGFALTRLLKTVALAFMLKRNAPVFPVGETFGFLARVAVCTCLTAVCAWLALRGLDSVLGGAALHDKIFQAARVCAGGAGGVLGALAGFWLLRIREPYEMLAWLLARAKQRKIA